jgi:hypothetical protein
VPWRSLGALPSKAEKLCQKADETYEAESWPRSVAKDQCDAKSGKTWGITVEGDKGTVSIAREKRLLLAAITLERLSSKWTGRQFCSLLGLWSAILQMRRPGYSILASCFNEFSPNQLDMCKHLSHNSRIELFILSCLAPLLETNVRAEIADVIGATDASEEASGMCRVKVPFAARVKLYDRCEGKGEHVYLNLPYVPNVEEKLKSSLDALKIVNLPWKATGSVKFNIPEHINILEARALLDYVRLCVREKRVSQRIIVIIDSGVVKGAVRKFRSSSKGLNHVLRQLAGLCLACDLYLELLWVPTWANPSDAPSRNSSISAWRHKAEACQNITLKALLDDGTHGLDALASFEACREWTAQIQLEQEGIQDTSSSSHREWLGTTGLACPIVRPGCVMGSSAEATAAKKDRYEKQSKILKNSARKETWELLCGSGHLAAALSDIGFRSHGVDRDFEKFGLPLEARHDKVQFHSWDLLDDNCVQRFCFQLRLNRILFIHFGMDC